MPRAKVWRSECAVLTPSHDSQIVTMLRLLRGWCTGSFRYSLMVRADEREVYWSIAEAMPHDQFLPGAA